MQPHVKALMDYFGYDASDFIRCEYCRTCRAVDVHHVEYRSHFGKKRREECNSPPNLIFLCRECHDKAHNDTITKEELFNIIKSR